MIEWDLRFLFKQTIVLYPFPALVTPFHRAVIIKGNPNNERNPPSYPFPAFMTPFPDMTFINEEVRDVSMKKS